jgi:hypothetical protein
MRFVPFVQLIYKKSLGTFKYIQYKFYVLIGHPIIGGVISNRIDLVPERPVNVFSQKLVGDISALLFLELLHLRFPKQSIDLGIPRAEFCGEKRILRGPNSQMIGGGVSRRKRQMKGKFVCLRSISSDMGMIAVLKILR